VIPFGHNEAALAHQRFGMLRAMSIVIAGAVLSACSSNPKDPFASADAILKPILALKGKTEAEAIAYLGKPKEETRRVDGRTLLWHEDNDPALATSQSNRDFVILRPHCLIRANVDARDVITDISFDGDAASFCPRGP
jgi:hypothetical protein